MGASPLNVVLVQLTAGIVSAFVSNNSVPTGQLGELISSVHASLTGISSGDAPVVTERAPPVVPVRKSVAPHSITCLLDGKRFKSLKRHLASHHHMTPEQYRAHFDLPSTYPMTAPEYAERRSQIARSLGLGRKPKPEATAVEPGQPAKRERPKAASAESN